MSQVKRPEDATWWIYETESHICGLNEAGQNLCCALSCARLGSRPASQRGHFLKHHYVKKEFLNTFGGVFYSLEKTFAWSASEDNNKEESGALDEVIEGRATDMENENRLWSQKAKNL